MTFGQALRICLRKFLRFGGRASRAEYWFFVLAFVVANLVAGTAVVISRALPKRVRGNIPRSAGRRQWHRVPGCPGRPPLRILPAMERTSVRSSSVAAVGYDEGQQILELEFRSGAVYQYLHVGSDIHRLLLDVPSIGAFVNRIILPTYEAQRVH